MKAIKITAAVAAELENNTWVIVNADSLVDMYKSRQAAREDKKVRMITGTICNKSEIEFEVDQPVAVAEESKPPVAPIGAEIEGDVHDYVCPHCGIDLHNGVGEHLQEVNGKPIKHDRFEYECLACGKEFGPEIKKDNKAPAPAKTGRKIEVTHTSSIDRPCKTVWAIADSMKGSKRREVLAECVKQGIAFYTARTQYQQWLGIQKEMALREAEQNKAK